MITVMFPTGVRVTYNDVHHIKWWENGNGATLKDKDNGTVIAHVDLRGGGCLEWRRPCAVTAAPVASVKSAMEVLVNELNRQNITGWDEECLLRDLKNKLQRFNARKKVWK